TPPPIRTTPFPYTTLFRSKTRQRPADPNEQEQEADRLQRERAERQHRLERRPRGGVVPGRERHVPATEEQRGHERRRGDHVRVLDRKSTRLNSSHQIISYA